MLSKGCCNGIFEIKILLNRNKRTNLCKVDTILKREGVDNVIKYYTDKKVNYERLISLFNEAGWNDKTEDMDRLRAMVDNSQIVVTAWDDDEMIGFGRCTTDFVFNGQINNVVVDSKYRGKGIGKELITRILDNSKMVTYMLRGQESEGFYKKLGFEDAIGLVYRRKK